MTGDAVVELIRNDERGFAGTGDIASHFGVTRQAVRNRREELRHHPDLAVTKVGKTTVFYIDDDGDSVEEEDRGGGSRVAGTPDQLDIAPRARLVGGSLLLVALVAAVLASGLGGMVAAALVALAPALAAAGGVLVAASYVVEWVEFSNNADGLTTADEAEA